MFTRLIDGCFNFAQQSLRHGEQFRQFFGCLFAIVAAEVVALLFVFQKLECTNKNLSFEVSFSQANLYVSERDREMKKTISIRAL